MIRFIINSRYIKMFQFMYDKKKCSMKEISKHTNFHFMHVRTVMMQFQEEGLIKPIFEQEEAEHKKEKGSPYLIELSKKGQAVQKLLNMFNRLYLGLNEQYLIELILDLKEQEVKHGRI